MGGPTEWLYRLAFRVEPQGRHRNLVHEEVVEHQGKRILDRPTPTDLTDTELLTETALEQVHANRDFRQITEFLNQITYLHLVPQMVRHGAEIGGNRLENDPYGQGFLEKIGSARANTRESYLRKIAQALSSITPGLQDLTFERDKGTGRPHLRAKFENWRTHDVSQRENHLSDGTLRLIGLFWSLMEEGTLLLEEPEISLDKNIAMRLGDVINRLKNSSGSKSLRSHTRDKQVLLTTHSSDLLSDAQAEDILRIEPGKNGSTVKPIAEYENPEREMQTIREGAMSRGASKEDGTQMSLFATLFP